MENKEIGRKEELRRRLWIEVAIAVAGSTANTCSDTPSVYADVTLNAYDRRFKKESN